MLDVEGARLVSVNMKRAAFLTLLLAIALPAFAGWWPVFSNTAVNVPVGETETVWVTVHISGFSVPEVRWDYSSSDPAVATAEVFEQTYPRRIDITGVAPGEASLRLGDGTWQFVGITVTCASEPAVQAGTPVAHVHIGDAVDLVAVSPIAHRSVFTWYEGRTGDDTHPLSATGSVWTFAPTQRGTQYVWVRATTPCSMSSAEFRIDADIPKRRAVRR